MSRTLAKLSWITASLWACAGPAAVQAELITYSWSGRIESYSGSPSNPWDLSGDGNELTPGDGTPYSISIVVDSAATETPGNSVGPGEDIAYFIPTSVNLLIDGVAATDFAYNGSDSGLRLWDNVAGNSADSIGFRADITFAGTSLFAVFDNRVANDTFDILSLPDPDSPALFDSASLISNGGSVTADLITFGGTVTTSVEAIPEPSSMLLVAVVGGGAAWRRWRTLRKNRS